MGALDRCTVQGLHPWQAAAQEGGCNDGARGSSPPARPLCAAYASRPGPSESSYARHHEASNTWQA